MKAMYTFWGKVKRGKNRGKTLGFPTANISLHKKIPEGIYASVVAIRHSGNPPAGGASRISKRFWIPHRVLASPKRRSQDDVYKAATFIGSAKTFKELDYKAESFILDFNADIYGKFVTVKLYKKIRDNKQFRLGKELIDQMQKDIEKTREFFK